MRQRCRVSQDAGGHVPFFGALQCGPLCAELFAFPGDQSVGGPGRNDIRVQGWFLYRELQRQGDKVITSASEIEGKAFLEGQIC